MRKKLHERFHDGWRCFHGGAAATNVIFSSHRYVLAPSALGTDST